MAIAANIQVIRIVAGTKTVEVLELLRRPGGASVPELRNATGWQPHSVRGFLSGIIGKKMGLSVTSRKGDEGVYCLP